MPVGLSLYMAFWGNELQREIAITILTTGGIAVAGFGIIHAVSKGIQALLIRR